ncbi:MAG: hypothetical protein JWM41_3914 [Gemmatimonadetes bacterium]|nr:hypothetical protein [Gemmatimonadota bacterium]
MFSVMLDGTLVGRRDGSPKCNVDLTRMAQQDRPIGDRQKLVERVKREVAMCVTLEQRLRAVLEHASSARFKDAANSLDWSFITEWVNHDREPGWRINISDSSQVFQVRGEIAPQPIESHLEAQASDWLDHSLSDKAGKENSVSRFESEPAQQMGDRGPAA